MNKRTQPQPAAWMGRMACHHQPQSIICQQDGCQRDIYLCVFWQGNVYFLAVRYSSKGLFFCFVFLAVLHVFASGIQCICQRAGMYLLTGQMSEFEFLAETYLLAAWRIFACMLAIFCI